MALFIRVNAAAMVLFGALAASAQSNNTAPMVQPGAPGQASKVITAASLPAARPPSKADIEFMQGMIMHHGQAVEMADLLATRGRSPALQEFGKRIRISQTDEMQFMKQWLTDRGQSTMMAHDMSHMGAEMPHGMKNMPDMAMMPGMLTQKQMNTLRKASGPKFDHLFLTGMIQHHGGALTMVQDLFSSAGAGQDAVLYDFATDVDNTQSAEIEIMKGMLAKEKK